MKYFLIAVILYTPVLQSMPGCMQIGNRLTTPDDSKAFTFTHCNCPCNQYTMHEVRSQCAECKHYHVPHTSIILTNVDFEKAHQLARAHTKPQ